LAQDCSLAVLSGKMKDVSGGFYLKEKGESIRMMLILGIKKLRHLITEQAQGKKIRSI
jgi:hypothetical protein